MDMYGLDPKGWLLCPKGTLYNGLLGVDVSKYIGHRLVPD